MMMTLLSKKKERKNQNTTIQCDTTFSYKNYSVTDLHYRFGYIKNACRRLIYELQHPQAKRTLLRYTVSISAAIF